MGVVAIQLGQHLLQQPRRMLCFGLEPLQHFVEVFDGRARGLLLRCNASVGQEALCTAALRRRRVGGLLWRLVARYLVEPRGPDAKALCCARPRESSQRTYRIGNCLSTWERLDCSIGGAPDLAFCILVLTLLPEPSFPILLIFI